MVCAWHRDRIPAGEYKDRLQMRLSSIIYIWDQAPEMKSDYTHGTLKETLRITHSSCSEGAFNLIGEVCHKEKINIKDNRENKVIN